ncbi:MAG: phosphatase PAP2 family protein [Nitrospiraceae bacterium]|nr:phosphatase PAP2 family protein [Nitrospiraceae bacterium]
MSKESSENLSPGPPTHHASRITHHVPLLLSCAALALLFCAAFQMDRPAIEWVRSLQGIWIKRIGDAGYVIGSGVSLIVISGLFVAAGYARANPAWRKTGLRGWMAHALTAIFVQGLKHGIGRPRPRLHREDEFFTGPSLELGLDAFPSGHASASFAVATVVAKHCPALAWPCYALAGFVAVTRVFRGSHFVSDVVAGVVLGIVVGTLVATPIQEWKATLRHVLLSGTPWLVVACAAVWLAILPSSGTMATGLLAAAGASVLVASYCLYRA